MKYKDIERLTRSAHYRLNNDWEDLEDRLHKWQHERIACLDLNPEFQRGHVWTQEQQIAYVEFKLRGGEGSDIIYFNCPGWMNDFRGPFVLVDGKQRLTAVMRFLKNEIPAFGHYRREFEGRIPPYTGFIFAINDLPTTEAVLKWYLEMNSGGTPHTQEELDKVREMLEKGK